MNLGCAGGAGLFKSPVKTPQDVIKLENMAKEKPLEITPAVEIQVLGKNLEASNFPCNHVFGEKMSPAIIGTSETYDSNKIASPAVQ